jgi:hypothetical protein
MDIHINANFPFSLFLIILFCTDAESFFISFGILQPLMLQLTATNQYGYKPSDNGFLCVLLSFFAGVLFLSCYLFLLLDLLPSPGHISTVYSTCLHPYIFLPFPFFFVLPTCLSH